MKKRTKGGQPGNKNAAGRRKDDTARNVTFKLYQRQIDLLAAIVESQGTNASQEVRVAIEEWAKELELLNSD